MVSSCHPSSPFPASLVCFCLCISLIYSRRTVDGINVMVDAINHSNLTAFVRYREGIETRLHPLWKKKITLRDIITIKLRDQHLISTTYTTTDFLQFLLACYGMGQFRDVQNINNNNNNVMAHKLEGNEKWIQVFSSSFAGNVTPDWNRGSLHPSQVMVFLWHPVVFRWNVDWCSLLVVCLRLQSVTLTWSCPHTRRQETGFAL